MESDVKPPPPQKIEAGGMAFGGQMGEAVDVDWPKLFRLPTFQKYVEEQVQCRAGVRAEMHAALFAKEAGDRIGPQALYADYCAWHTRTGLWPKENPDGSLTVSELDYTPSTCGTEMRGLQGLLHTHAAAGPCDYLDGQIVSAGAQVLKMPGKPEDYTLDQESI